MILKVNMRNFRGVSEREVTFGPRKNLIKGPNEIGKTTIAHLLSFAYYGVDLHGGKNPDHLITIGANECQVSVQSENATFIRRKKRGKASEVKIVREGYPDLKPTQTELTKLLGMEYDLFGSCFHAGHFMALSDLKKREVISQAWKADRPALLRQLLSQAGANQDWEQRLIKLDNPRLDADAVARDRQMLQNQHASDAGALSQIQAQIKEAMAVEGDSEQLRAMEEELKTLRAQSQLQELYEQDLRNYQNAMNVYAERAAENKRKDEKLEKLKLEIAALGVMPEVDTSALDAKRNELMKQSNELKPLPPPPSVAIPHKMNEDICTRCGQRVGDKLKADMAQERDRLLMEYNEKQREVADKNGEILREKESLENQLREVGAQINTQKQASIEWGVKKKYLDRTKAELIHAPNPKPTPPDSHEGGASVKGKLSELEAKYQAQKLVEGRAAGLAVRERDLLNALESKKQRIDQLQILQDCLKKLPEVEVAQTMEKFKLHKAQVAFFEGEVLVTDEKGLPYLSLSDGRRMKVDLEWAKCFQRLVPKAPKFIFIDNADLVDSFDEYWPEELQVLMVQVRGDLKQLEVVQL